MFSKKKIVSEKVFFSNFSDNYFTHESPNKIHIGLWKIGNFLIYVGSRAQVRENFFSKKFFHWPLEQHIIYETANFHKPTIFFNALKKYFSGALLTRAT